MVENMDYLSQYEPWQYIAAAVAGLTTIVTLKKLMSKNETIAVEADTVMLYQFTRGPHTPSLSPLVVKLETYLRMAKIPYKTDTSSKLSSKGKCPWMSYNGVHVADSQFCIEYLNKERGIDLNKHLSEEQRGIAQAFRRMMEDGLYWGLCQQRWTRPQGFYYLKNEAKFPRWLLYLVRHQTKKYLYGQGTGRHTDAEVDSMVEKDLRALSQYLGDKQFLMGDNPCEEDCALFAFVSLCKWGKPAAVVSQLMNGDLKNLSTYADRMKDLYWPDWDECLLQD